MENALIPESPTAALRAAAIAALLLATSGCSVFKENEETQTVVSQRTVGMQVGTFFDRYGRPKVRELQGDGSFEYLWLSAIGETPNRGWDGLDDKICTLRLIVSKDGKILAATVVKDTPGRNSMSRCVEIFKAA